MNLYRQNNRRGRRATQTATVLVIVLYFFDVLSGGLVRNVVRGASAPVYQIVASVFSRVDMIGAFSSRAALARENVRLENQIIALTAKAETVEILRQENAHLQALLNMTPPRSGRAARVITIRKASPYGTFMIDTGANTGIMAGDVVLIEGGFVVGTVTSTTANTAIVNELFASGNALDVVFEGTSAKIVGQGGGNAQAQIPRGIAIHEGSVAISHAYGGAPVGIVGKVTTDPASAYSVVYLRTPVNIDSVGYVYVASALR